MNTGPHKGESPGISVLYRKNENEKDTDFSMPKKKKRKDEGCWTKKQCLQHSQGKSIPAKLQKWREIKSSLPTFPFLPENARERKHKLRQENKYRS